MTPQEKIDEIYAILQKQEKRENRKNIFRWTIRIIAVTIFLLLALYPSIILGALTNFLYPIIQENIKQIIVEQKNNLLDSVGNQMKNISNSLNN